MTKAERIIENERRIQAGFHVQINRLRAGKKLLHLAGAECEIFGIAIVITAAEAQEIARRLDFHKKDWKK